MCAIDDNPQLFLRRARKRLARRPPVLDAAQGRPAAVLMALTEVAGAWHFIFTRRAAALPDHAGEVSFPGGRLRAGEDARAAALREAHEEIGLPPAAVQVIGFGDVCATGSGHVVAPVLGLVRAPVELRPCPREVAAIFTAPAAHVLNAANYRCARRFHRGKWREYWSIPWGGHDIWGATARMLRQLTERLHDA